MRKTKNIKPSPMHKQENFPVRLRHLLGKNTGQQVFETRINEGSS
jgi:hypothetical protein